jgi:hemoglobin/transferrin/lactoferrin receptor protein
MMGGMSWVRVLLPLLLLISCHAPLWALDGRVVDQRNGAPLPNAEVSILGLAGVVRTDEDGRFTWKPDPVPPFEVLVVLPGGRVLRPVLVETLAHGQPLLIQVTSIVEESITVTGSAPSIEATPGSGTTLLTSREIQSRQPATLVQALENTPGVAVVSEGHAAVPALRGLARGRTLILIDGARVTSERRVGPSATFLDPFSLDGVEVARGPGSVAYGSDAFGGVIYARTRRPEPGAPLRLRGIFSLGTGVPQGRAGLELSRGFAEGGVLVQGHYRRLDDYRSPAGDVFNSGARDAGLLVKAEQRLGPGVLAGGWQSDVGRDIERPRDNSHIVRFSYPEETSHRFTVSYDLRQIGGFHRVNVNGFFGSQSTITDQDRFATSAEPRRIERADISARDFHVRGYGERHVGRVKVEVGAEAVGRFGLRAVDSLVTYPGDASGASTREHVSIDDARRTNTGAYVAMEAPLAAALVVSGGMRADRVTTRNRGGDFGDRATSQQAASGFLSLTLGPRRGWSITGQIARGFRDPLLSDRYFRGPSGRGFITGNPDLQPERSLQYDAVARYTAARYRLAVYAYQYRLTDLIERYQTTLDTFFFRNRGRARVRGLEAELQADLGSGWTLELSGDVPRGTALDDGQPMDDIASPTLTAQIRKQLPGSAYTALRATAHARDDRPGPTERDTPGYVRVDANGGIPLTRHVELQVSARNLLDAEYLASPDPRAVPAPGIAVLASAVVRF